MPKLNILGLSLSTPEPYKPGHVCTAAEASVLNAALTRGLAKGIYRELREVYDREQRLSATSEDEVRVQAFITSYLKGFSEGHERLRAIEAEARRIGRSRAEAALYRHGKRAGDIAPGELAALVAREAEKPDVLAEATRRIDTLRSLGRDEAGSSLEELAEER